MSAAYAVRKASAGIRWPRLAICRPRGRKGTLPEESECICRFYDELDGYYVLNPQGHAVAYFTKRGDAVHKAEVLNRDTTAETARPSPAVERTTSGEDSPLFSDRSSESAPSSDAGTP